MFFSKKRGVSKLWTELAYLMIFGFILGLAIYVGYNLFGSLFSSSDVDQGTVNSYQRLTGTIENLYSKNEGGFEYTEIPFFVGKGMALVGFDPFDDEISISFVKIEIGSAYDTTGFLHMPRPTSCIGGQACVCLIKWANPGIKAVKYDKKKLDQDVYECHKLGEKTFVRSFSKSASEVLAGDEKIMLGYVTDVEIDQLPDNYYERLFINGNNFEARDLYVETYRHPDGNTLVLIERAGLPHIQKRIKEIDNPNLESLNGKFVELKAELAGAVLESKKKELLDRILNIVNLYLETYEEQKAQGKTSILEDQMYPWYWLRRAEIVLQVAFDNPVLKYKDVLNQISYTTQERLDAIEKLREFIDNPEKFKGDILYDRDALRAQEAIARAHYKLLNDREKAVDEYFKLLSDPVFVKLIDDAFGSDAMKLKYKRSIYGNITGIYSSYFVSEDATGFLAPITKGIDKAQKLGLDELSVLLSFKKVQLLVLSQGAIAYEWPKIRCNEYAKLVQSSVGFVDPETNNPINYEIMIHAMRHSVPRNNNEPVPECVKLVGDVGLVYSNLYIPSVDEIHSFSQGTTLDSLNKMLIPPSGDPNYIIGWQKYARTFLYFELLQWGPKTPGNLPSLEIVDKSISELNDFLLEVPYGASDYKSYALQQLAFINFLLKPGLVSYSDLSWYNNGCSYLQKLALDPDHFEDTKKLYDLLGCEGLAPAAS